MKIGILGSGQVGQTLGSGFAAHGHDVMIGTREPERAELRKWRKAAKGKASIGTLAEAAAHGDLLVLACHGTAALDVIDAAGPTHFDGKVLVDVTNPLEFNDGNSPGLFVGVTDSLGERVQRKLPRAKVVKAFNTMNATTMVKPKMREGLADLLVCGEDKGAKRAFAKLAKEFGFGAPIDLGGIEAARWMEAWVPLWVRIADDQGSWNVALRILRE